MASVLPLPAFYYPGYYKIMACLQGQNPFAGKLIEKLLPEEYQQLEELASLQKINLSGFPRVPFPLYQQKMVDCLNGLQPERLLYLFPGRGNAMWKIWEICGQTEITAFDTNPDQIAVWQHLQRGGLGRFSCITGSQAWEIPFHGLYYDAITWQIAHGYSAETLTRVLKACTQLSQKFIILTLPLNFPVKNNELEGILRDGGILSCKWEKFPNHWLAIARK